MGRNSNLLVATGRKNYFKIAVPKIDLSIAYERTKIPYQGLSSAQLMDKVINALDNKTPCSIISVGATEAFVMAQNTIFSETELMNHPEAQIANLGVKSGFFHRGIRFPNLTARDEAIEAVSRADIVGYNLIVESARNLTEQVMAINNIKPSLIYEANLRRVIMFSQKEKFEAMLKNRKILLIGSLAPQARTVLEQNYKTRLGFEIVGAISIYEYEEIIKVKKEILNYQFDLCLLAAGINAVILAPFIAEELGKVAFDIGWGMESLIKGEIVMDEWLVYIIGIENLMSM